MTLLLVALIGSFGTALVVATLNAGVRARLWSNGPYLKLRVVAALHLKGCNFCSDQDAFVGVRYRHRVRRRASKCAEECSLARIDETGFELWNTPMGPFWTPPRFGRSSIGLVVAEQQADVYGSSGLAAGSVVVDCGANIGAFTRHAINSGAGRVIAVEPGPDNLVCLKRNFAKEIDMGVVSLCENGVWGKDAQLPLYIGPQSTQHSLFDNTKGTPGEQIQVSVTTIESLCARFELASVDFIKLDVEGAEVEALDGARGVLARHRPVVAVAAEHTPDRLANVTRVLQVMGGIWPRYTLDCRVCTIARSQHVLPEILVFRQGEPALEASY